MTLYSLHSAVNITFLSLATKVVTFAISASSHDGQLLNGNYAKTVFRLRLRLCKSSPMFAFGEYLLNINGEVLVTGQKVVDFTLTQS